jgi:hypothetical protein
MKVLGQLCGCRLCVAGDPQGYWHPCGCPIGREADDHDKHKVEGVMVEGQVYPLDRVVDTGGRNAVWIYLEDGEFVEWLSARRVGEEITEWYGQPVEVVARFPASVHGCWKVSARQELVVLRKKKK